MDLRNNLKQFHCQIPVYRGASKSFIWTPPSDNYFGKDGFGDFDFPNPPNPDDLIQKEHAVNALVEIVTQNPGMYKQMRSISLL
jgi:inosine-uridine nucleoside N-ribohydrolase